VQANRRLTAAVVSGMSSSSLSQLWSFWRALRRRRQIARGGPAVMRGDGKERAGEHRQRDVPVQASHRRTW
jgi:hypothetical protein